MTQKSMPPVVVSLAIIMVFMLVAVGGFIFMRPPWGTAIFFVVMFIMVGTLLLYWGLSQQQTYRDNTAYQRVRAQLAGEKPKRGENLAELMSVLSDNDLYDLRQHIKQRLANQVDAGDDQYFETFEALLAETEAKRKRG